MAKILANYGGLLAAAMGQTLLLALCGLFFACIIGLVVGLMSVVKNRACNIIATIFVDVVSAEESIFSGEASFVALPGQEGELGILPGHVPLLTRIRPGAVRITTTEGTQENVFVAGGILEVQPDRVTVLADTAIRSKDLDEAKAKQALEEAKLHRAKAQSNMEIAKLEATMAALAAQIAYIKRMRH